VIVAIDEESADSPMLAARVQALRDRRLGKIALLTIGGGITYGAGVAAGTGALGNLSPPARERPRRARQAERRHQTGEALGLAADDRRQGRRGGCGRGTLAGAAIVAWPDEPGPHELAGTWTIDDWQVVDGRIVPADFAAELEPEQLVITPDPEDCRGDACSLDAVRTFDGEEAGTFTLEPTADGWRGELDETWTCTDDAGEIIVDDASAGRATYLVRQSPDSDVLAVTYTFEGTRPTRELRTAPVLPSRPSR
jgi:hypothetical protein